MKYSFKGPKAKIARAKKLLGELERECADYLESSTNCSARIVYDAKPLRIEMKIVVNPIPEAISTIVGDVVHNLRAALDLAMCDLVEAAGKSIKGVHFPFCEKPGELGKAIKDKHIKRAGPDAVALVKSFQPYKGGNVALRSIHDLDVRDKHQSLIPAVAMVSGPIIRLWDDDGTRIPRIMGNPNKATGVKLVFPAGTDFTGKGFIETLESFVQLAESIVEAFVALANR